MRKIALILLSGLLLSGCAQNYTITLNSGSRITATTKPKLVHSNYLFKDAQGRDSYLPMGRVMQIAPASEANDDNLNYKATR